jgi:hypothetical protein
MVTVKGTVFWDVMPCPHVGIFGKTITYEKEKYETLLPRILEN